MKVFSFVFKPDIGGIVLKAYINGYKLNLLLDTGATNTVIDLNFLLMADIDFKSTGQKVNYETASGTIGAEIFETEHFRCLGINKPNFHFGSYDFLESGIVQEFDGMLGLDFFKNHKICIDFIHSEITVS